MAQKAGPPRRHAGQRRDHRRARRRAWRRRGRARHARDGHGHQFVPHAQQRRGASRPRRRGRRRGRHPARTTSATRPARPRRRRLRLAAPAHRPARSVERSAARPPRCRQVRTACAAWTGSTAAARRSWTATLGGAFAGLTLHHGPRICTARCSKRRRSACAGLSRRFATAVCPCGRLSPPAACPITTRSSIQIYADVLGEPITVHPSKHGPALGAALLGALAAGAFASPGAAIRAMATPKPGTAAVFKPNRRHRATYDALYREYRRLGAFFSAAQGA